MAGLIRYGVAFQNSVSTGGTAAAEIIAHATRGYYFRSVIATLTNAVFSPYAVGRPAARGVTPGTLQAFEALANEATPARKSLAQVATTWGTSPTTPATLLSWLAINAAIGGTRAFVPSSPIYIGPGQSLCLWNGGGGTSSATCFTVEIDEVAD